MHHNRSTNNDQRKTRNERLKTLAIILARGGKKGVPGKNIKEFNGKPLIQYAVDCALNSKEINRILVNSDDQQILDSVNTQQDPKRITKQLRPENLGKDNSSIVDVVLDALKRLEDNFDIILLMQTTSPIRSPKDITQIIKYFEIDKNLEAVISVIPMEDMHPARMYELDQKSHLSPLIKSDESTHRQNLKPIYFRNGCFYAIKTEAFLKQQTFMPKNKKAYVMNPDHLLNIDTQRDVKLAEVLIKAWENKEL
ncbi:cytidylyltransferase domain-containing protein [Flavobacterium sp. CS20]|uniref:acylneuraminate cytidylyltransferase family protein n=1 Tax=Flavobacterium sp. CS20 TaxID=2775246 RepID=UPI002110FED6|nr:acylneuraminate cytidylyltransferase family protein [Flavobacterium sp. CS20]